MTAQMISPQTTIPTAHAAIQEPCQRVSVTLPCLVTGDGMPILVKAVDLQPVVASRTRPSMAASGVRRRRERARTRRGAVAGSRGLTRPAARPGLSASPWRGALRSGLTDCLPSGLLPAPLAGLLLVLQPVVENSTAPACRAWGDPRCRTAETTASTAAAGYRRGPRRLLPGIRALTYGDAGVSYPRDTPTPAG